MPKHYYQEKSQTLKIIPARHSVIYQIIYYSTQKATGMCGTDRWNLGAMALLLRSTLTSIVTVVTIRRCPFMREVPGTGKRVRLGEGNCLPLVSTGNIRLKLWMKWMREGKFIGPLQGILAKKVYLDNSGGIPVQDIWADVLDARNQNAYITGYPTEKNPALLSRIILASSTLETWCSTVILGRARRFPWLPIWAGVWIGVDSSDEAIQTTLQRFQYGSQRMGDYVNTKRHQRHRC